MNATKLRLKGQITLPKQVCDILGLKVGDIIEWTAEDGRIIGRKLAPDEASTVKPVRRGGRWHRPVKLPNADIANAIRADRDSR